MKKFIGLSVAAIALTAATANAQFLGSAVVGNIPDNNTTGVSSTINVGSAFGITGIAITLNQATHTWIGDLIVSITAPNGTTTTILNRPGVGVSSSTVGASVNINGSYRFTDRFGAQNFSALGGGQTDISLRPFGTPPGNVWSGVGVTGAPAPLGSSSSTAVMQAGDWIASGNSGSGTTYALRYTEPNLLALLGSQSNGIWRLKITDNAGADTGSVATWTLALLPEPASMSLLALGAVAFLRRRK